jgi:hypothetical protein
LLAGKQIELEPFEQDAYDRLVARVFADGSDVNGALVREGRAWAYRKYMTRADAAYCTYEHEARNARRGLWALASNERIAPWEWRKHSVATDYSHATAENCVAAIGSAARPTIRPFASPVATKPSSGFRCGTKAYCREMTSCDEALFHLRDCGLTSIDGDMDGVPCETLCR